jgi:hypothetical protein
MIAFLTCLGDWVQNLDGNGPLLPSWFILSEFLLRTFLLTLHLPGFFIWIHHPPTSRTRVNPARRCKHRRRPRHEPWFGRRQRARWRARLARIDHTRWEWDGTPSEWLASWFQDNSHRFLHLNTYSSYFDGLCSVNPDLILILLGHSPFDFDGYNDQVVLDWGFLDIDGPLTDTSSHAVDSSRVLPSRLFSDGLRFQSIFFTDADAYPVVFDTGATISVSPCAQDFISWESQGNLTTKLHGLTASTDVMGVGIVRWTIRNDKGRRRVPDGAGPLAQPATLLA